MMLNYDGYWVKIRQFDHIVFLRQLATLIASGIPILQSCDILSQCHHNTLSQSIINKIRHDILNGYSLSYSFQRHPSYFDSLTTQLIQLGEQTGKLEAMIDIAANYHEKKRLFKNNIKQILFYPCIVTITALMITICMFLFVIPRFAELFQDAQIELPTITLIIFFISNTIENYFWLIFITIIFLIIAYHQYLHSKKALSLKALFLHLPIINTIAYKIILTQFARYLALTTSAGLPISIALPLAARTCGHIEFYNIVNRLNRKICAGQPLHLAMATIDIFPILMIQMIKIGEESGTFEHMLNKYADLSETDINHLTHRLSQLLEPLIMIVLGALIGVLVAGMYLPIFKLGNAL